MTQGSSTAAQQPSNQPSKGSLPRETFPFIGASLLNSVGGSLMWPLVTIYVHNVLHRSYGEAGLVLFFQALAGIVGQFVGGSLFNRLGPKRLIVGSILLSGVSQFSLIIAKAWVPYIIAMTVAGFLNAVTMPAVSAFIGFRWKSQRTRIFNTVYVSNNIGVAIGTSLAGVLAAVSFNLTFLFNGVSTIIFGCFFYLFFNKRGYDTGIPDVSTGMVRTRDTSVLSMLKGYPHYLFLGLGAMMVYLSMSSWNNGVAPFINQQGLPASRYSVLWTVNGLVILFAQPLMSLVNRKLTRSLYHRLILSAILYCCAYLWMFLTHGNYADLVIGMVIGTLGEMLIQPTIPSIVTETSGNAAAFYLGVVGSLGSVGRLLGPLIFGNLFDAFGLSPIQLTTTIATLVAAVLFALHTAVKNRPAARRTLYESQAAR